MKRMLLILMIVLVSACDRTRGMDTRTYTITRLTMDEALQLLTPYIREGGYLSGKGHLLTVREKPDRLKVVEDLLKKYDGFGVVQDVAMRIQIVEANGFTARDSSIADIEGTLREMFKYKGYRLAGETQVRAREESSFRQTAGTFKVAGNVGRLYAERVPVTIELADADNRVLLSSTITAAMRKPVVLGQSSGSGAIILIIRPSLAGT